VAGSLVSVAAVLAVFALVPSHSGPAKGVRVAPHAPVFGQTTPAPILPSETPAEAKARKSAEAVVRPLAMRFVDDVLTRRKLSFAYALLSPDLRSGASLHDWRQGRYLPLAAGAPDASVSIAYSGPTTVGIVSSIGSNRLVALRFDKAKGRWLVDYLHEGHGSSYVDDQNYAPAGFLPGSHTETLWTWLALIGGFLAVVAVAVFFEAWLRDSRT
jgi:hypothetical protein